MFGFVRPAACRSSAPRSVADGCPYPPLPCRAKNRNKIQLSSHRKQEINGNGWNAFHRLRTPSTVCGDELLPPPAGGPPPSRREVWGLRRSRPLALPSIAYRGFAVAPITLRAPSRNLVYNPGCRVETLLRPLSAVNRNLPGNSHSRASAPCDFRFPPCFFPHSGRMAPIPLIP